MALQRQLWSINELSTELGTDRRTLARRLEGLKPTQENPKLYALRPVLDHLQMVEGDLHLEDPMDVAHRAMHLTVTVLAENIRRQLLKTFKKVGPHDAQKALELTDACMLVFSWIAFRFATEVLHCENEQYLQDITRIGGMAAAEEREKV